MRKPTRNILQGQTRSYQLVILCLFLSAYSIEPTLFAQRPLYTISATLDTVKHELTGMIEIQYTNHADVSLDKLGIHLWPNAYHSRQSALAHQMADQGDLSLMKARLQDMGGIVVTGFNTDKARIPLVLDSLNKDMGWLILDQPLAPGETVTVSTYFTLTIPVSFSRMGRTGSSYQLTQWYPHLAVLDSLGWHRMPYLDQGEFFNDFADYKVHLQVPSGYMVAATGILDSISNASNQKDWYFTATNVIDFAWFASSTFRKETTTVEVGEHKKVELNIYHDTPGEELWTRAQAWATRALQFYSDWLGPYPYPQMSVVYAPFSQGGYMEYPMVAQISYTSDSILLDQAIAHEIGHSWLYGILANDERTHPWMDEGLNSFLEWQYTKMYHTGYTDAFLPSIFSANGSMSDQDMLMHAVRFEHRLQPPAAPPEKQASEQYLFSAYVLPPQGLEMMQSMEGPDKMKEMFRTYFRDHQFTHVAPADMQSSFEASCDCDLNWFFKEWIHRAHEVDYRISRFDENEKEITLVNKGEAKVPLKLNTYKQGKPLLEHWINGFAGEKTIHLDDRADEVRLYEGMMGFNQKWSSNIKPQNIWPRWTLLPRKESYTRPTIAVTPVFGVNLADGFMPGVAFTSGLFPQQHFKFLLAPMFGLGSNQWRGHATFRYIGDMPAGKFDKYLLSLGLDDFGYNIDTHYLFRDHYFKWSPTAAVRFAPDADHLHRTAWIKYRYVHIDQYYGRGVDYDSYVYDDEHRSYGIQELLFQVRTNDVLRPYEAMANVQAGKGFVRLNVQYKQHFAGRTASRGVWVHGYAGWLPVYNNPDASAGFTLNGTASHGYFSRDYMFDEWLGGRNAVDGLFAHQIFQKDADLKTLSTIGNGDEWMLGGGVSAALPFRFIHAYMDAALFPSSVTEKVTGSYSGGVALVLWKDVFEVYVPILESKDIRESLTYTVQDIWYKRISFRANVKLVNPLNIEDRVQLGY